MRSSFLRFWARLLQRAADACLAAAYPAGDLRPSVRYVDRFGEIQELPTASLYELTWNDDTKGHLRLDDEPDGPDFGGIPDLPEGTVLDFGTSYTKNRSEYTARMHYAPCPLFVLAPKGGPRRFRAVVPDTSVPAEGCTCKPDVELRKGDAVAVDQKGDRVPARDRKNEW